MELTGSVKKPARFSRRRLLKMLGGTLLSGGGVYAYGAAVEANRLVVEHVAVTVPGLAKSRQGQRFVQLTDFHAGRTSIKLIEKSLAMALALKPEALLITGDFVDNKYVDMKEICGLLREAARHVAIIGCTGNHDFAHGNLAFADHVCANLAAANVRVLRNDAWQPTAGAGELCFVGVEDLWSGRLDAAALKMAPPDASVILLNHNPDGYENVADERWHVMLSGHTHGGQVCVPGIGPLILPVQHRERAQGLFHLNKEFPQRALYVSRGVGYLLQVRLFCPPEVTCITLTGTPA